jgi:hypothetical protein
VIVYECPGGHYAWSVDRNLRNIALDPSAVKTMMKDRTS